MDPKDIRFAIRNIRQSKDYPNAAETERGEGWLVVTFSWLALVDQLGSMVELHVCMRDQ